jgi:hypothetical protein
MLSYRGGGRYNVTGVTMYYRTGTVPVRCHVEQKDLVATDSGRDKGSKIRPRFDYREERLARHVS